MTYNSSLVTENPFFEQCIDMPPDMASEATEIITMAIDKYQTTKNYEVMNAHMFTFFLS